MTICTRHNTHVCTFGKESPQLTANVIHDWTNDFLKMEESDISMIKIAAAQRPMDILNEMNGVCNMTTVKDDGQQ
jgi:hypothetical protein